MSHEKDVITAGHVATTPDPPAVRALGNATPQLFAQMDGRQSVQWLTAKRETWQALYSID